MHKILMNTENSKTNEQNKFFSQLIAEIRFKKLE